MNEFEVEAVLEDLQEATTVESPEAVSLFPQDLGSVNNVLNMSLDFLMDDLVTNPDDPIPLNVVSVTVSCNTASADNNVCARRNGSLARY